MDVTILGRIGYDLCSEELHVKLPQVRRFSRYLGGSSANMAVGLARLGTRVGMLSCLGQDSLSQFLIDFLQAENVDTSHVQRIPGYLPSLAVTEVSPPDRFPQVFGAIGAERADLMLAGSAIFAAICALWPSPMLRVADRGLREGMLRQMRDELSARRRRASA